MANYYNSQSLSWLVTSRIPGMGSEWMSVSVFYNSSLREILSHASNVVHLKKRCTARLCEVGTKGFFLSISTKQFHNVRYKCCRCQPTEWINASVLSLNRGGGHFRNFWVGMCRWDPGTTPSTAAHTFIAHIWQSTPPPPPGLKSTWRRDKVHLYQPLHTIDARYYY